MELILLMPSKRQKSSIERRIQAFFNDACRLQKLDVSSCLCLVGGGA
jgi:hypothetical protein